MQIINQTNKTIDIQSISTPLIQIGEQLTLALVRWNEISNTNWMCMFLFLIEIFKNYR